MYVQDYDETFPFSAYLNGTCVATYYWALDPYVKNKQITQCPTEPQAMNVAALVGAPCDNTPPFTSYVVNHGLAVNGFYPGATPTALATVTRPADTILAYDGNVTSGANPGQQVQLVQARHQQGFNAGFVDGHVRSIQATETGTAKQFTVMGPGRELKTYKIGVRGGFYAGMNECLGVPQ
jgi:prepilin-type processing-associated H-X9-DG protein